MGKADVSAKIPPELKDRLRQAADNELCSESAIIRKALAFYLSTDVRLLTSNKKKVNA